MIESLHGHFKNDYVFTQEPMSFVETKLIPAAAVRHYNEKRPHSSLEYMTPGKYRKPFERVEKEVIQ